MNDEGRMTNMDAISVCGSKNDARRMSRIGALRVLLRATAAFFVIRISSFFRHSSFVIRHFLSLLLLSLLSTTGCTLSTTDSVLPVKHVRHWSMPAAGQKIPAPRSLCFGPNNEVFVLDNAGRVLVFSTAGKVLRQWEMPEHDVGKPEGICILADGRIAVADTHYSRVVFFDGEGNVLGMHGQQGRAAGEFIYPVAITQDGEQNYYVCEYGGNDRIQKFTAAGELLGEFGSFGTSPGQFQRPSGIVWHDAEVYVADAINNRIQVFSDDGEFQRVLGSAEHALLLHYPYDMVKDAHGDLYVAEYGAGRVTRLDRSGNILGRWGSTGSDKGRLATPWGLAIGGNNRILVADTGNRRLVELEL